MCLAVYKPSGTLPDWEAYAEGFRSNSHGAGFAVVDGGNLIIRKGFFTFDAFREALLPFANLQAAVHFRLATHGNKDGDNCHPFVVADGLSLIHNGILDIDCNQDKSKSDTWHYAKLILQPMAERDPDFFMRPEVVFLGESAIRGSKFVFLRADGEFSIWNEGSGHWRGDCWWSNSSYEQTRWWERPIRGFDDSPKEEEQDDESEYRDFLSGEVAWAYDDLLHAGYTAHDLDQLLREQGDDALIQFAEECNEEDGSWLMR